MTGLCHLEDQEVFYNFFGEMFGQVGDSWVFKLQALFSFSTFEQIQLLI